MNDHPLVAGCYPYDHPKDALGPRLFTHLADDEAKWLSEAQRDAIALDIRAALA